MDDTCLQADFTTCLDTMHVSSNRLHNLSLTIDVEISILEPTQQMECFGSIIDSKPNYL